MKLLPQEAEVIKPGTVLSHAISTKPRQHSQADLLTFVPVLQPLSIKFEFELSPSCNNNNNGGGSGGTRRSSFLVSKSGWVC